MTATRSFLLKLEEEKNTISQFAKSFTHFYTLWCVITLNLVAVKGKDVGEISKRYIAFMNKVETLAGKKDLESFIKSDTRNAL